VTTPPSSGTVRIARADDIPPSFGGLRLAHKKNPVRMRSPVAPEEFRTEWGVLVARPGEDVVVIDPSGSEAPVKKEVFERTYGETAHGEFRKHAAVRLVQVPPGVTAVLATREGDLEVRHPDYVVVGVDDEVYANAADWVAENLEFVA
jgi:hypothetical protein